MAAGTESSGEMATGGVRRCPAHHSILPADGDDIGLRHALHRLDKHLTRACDWWALRDFEPPLFLAREDPPNPLTWGSIQKTPPIRGNEFSTSHIISHCFSTSRGPNVAQE